MTRADWFGLSMLLLAAVCLGFLLGVWICTHL